MTVDTAIDRSGSPTTINYQPTTLQPTTINYQPTTNNQQLSTINYQPTTNNAPSSYH